RQLTAAEPQGFDHGANPLRARTLGEIDFRHHALAVYLGKHDHCQPATADHDQAGDEQTDCTCDECNAPAEYRFDDRQKAALYPAIQGGVDPSAEPLTAAVRILFRVLKMRREDQQ